MNKKFKRVLAIIGLVLMVPFIFFLILSLGFSTILKDYAPGLAAALACLIVMIFISIKMDDYRIKRKEDMQRANEQNLVESDEPSEEVVETSVDETQTAESIPSPDPIKSETDVK